MAGRAILAVDGAAKGNPGPAGIGIVISDESGAVLKEIGEYIGEATNNCAEYTALIRGLSEVSGMGFSEVSVYTDSELMARQINGRYQVRSEGLIPLCDAAQGLLRKFKSATIENVPRAKNKAADKLASAAAQQLAQPELALLGRELDSLPASGTGEGVQLPPQQRSKPAKKAKREESMIQRFTVHTSHRTEFIEITREVQDAVNSSGVTDGVCTVFIPHSTAAVTINENADAYVMRDIIDILNALVPQSAEYRHVEGNADSHAKASLIGSSVNVIVENGKLLLGQWQGIYFCEFDGPRTRQVFVRVG